MKSNPMFQGAPGNAVKSFKKHSDSYEAAKAIYTAARRKEVPLSEKERAEMERANIQEALNKFIQEKKAAKKKKENHTRSTKETRH